MLRVPHLVKTLPDFLGTRRFIATFKVLTALPSRILFLTRILTVFVIQMYILSQPSATYGTRAKHGTQKDFQWHAQ
jgi:hypothetical protein